ncbi:hypothetical protein TU78_03855 [Pseudomonas taetrolens]|uniref:Uncharacterized protein n=1 Tax=Pseudomonas taetrolens TaxID=47884 RepID=A0A0J6GVR2_PSETA|nr:hypothetical protein TU78_03855 [Pseudomonas taetrolens]
MANRRLQVCVDSGASEQVPAFSTWCLLSGAETGVFLEGEYRSIWAKGFWRSELFLRLISHAQEKTPLRGFLYMDAGE